MNDEENIASKFSPSVDSAQRRSSTRNCFADWDTSSCADRRAEVILAGMEFPSVDGAK